MEQKIRNVKIEAHISNLYQDISGFILYEENEKEKLISAKIPPLYGEITYSSLQKIIDVLILNSEDVFYDLGSGVGKIPLQFFLTTPVKKSIGIEGFSKRHESAVQVYREVHETYPELFSKGRILECIEGNFLHVDFSDATIIYIGCFDDDLLNHLSEIINRCSGLRYLISLTPLPCKLPFMQDLEVEYNFGIIDAYIYGFHDDQFEP